MIRCNANLFRLAFTCSSKEETRYYIGGVFVEPHASKGVTLTATDGHRLICVHDESGYATESAIIKLTPDALKACKPGRGERRDLVISTGENSATVCRTIADAGPDCDTLKDTPIAFSPDCRIEGTFPDYRRVVPQGAMILKEGDLPASFSAEYVTAFATLGLDLEGHFDRLPSRSAYSSTGRGILCIHTRDARDAALVRWSRVPEAFGVLMPCKAPDTSNSTPAWFGAPPAATADQEAAA